MCLLGFGLLVKTQKAMIGRPYLKPKPKTHVQSALGTKQATKLVSCFSIMESRLFILNELRLVRKGIFWAHRKRSVALNYTVFFSFNIWTRRIVAHFVWTVFEEIYKNKIMWLLKMMASSNVNHLPEKKTSFSCLSKKSINTFFQIYYSCSLKKLDDINLL